MLWDCALSEVVLKLHVKIDQSCRAGVAQWNEHWPANQKVASLIPSQGTARVAGQVPSWGHVRGN